MEYIVVQIVVVIFVEIQQNSGCGVSYPFLCNAGVMGWQPHVCMRIRTT